MIFNLCIVINLKCSKKEVACGYVVKVRLCYLRKDSIEIEVEGKINAQKNSKKKIKIKTD